MSARRIKLRRTKGWQLPAGAVNCARPGPWGNPFKVKRDGIRVECVELYARLLAGLICLREPPPFEAQETARDYVIVHREELRARDLACWCGLCDRHQHGKPVGVECPDCAPCHVDILLQVANP